MRRFSPGWVPTVAMVIAVAVLCSLGVWQLRRHQWREALLAEQRAKLELPPVPIAEAIRDPDAFQWRRATARGRYDREHTIVVQHVRRGLREGAQVLTPLLRDAADPAASDAAAAPPILIDRGWVPYREQDRFLPADLRSPGEKAPPARSPDAPEDRTQVDRSPAQGSPTPRVPDDRLPDHAVRGRLPRYSPAPPKPSDVVEVTGVVRPMDLGDAQPGTAAEPRTAWLRFNPADPTQPAALQSQLPYRLAPLLLQRQPETGPSEPPKQPEAPGTTRTPEAARQAGGRSGADPRAGSGASPGATAGTPARLNADAPQLPIPTAVQPESPVNHLAYAFQWFAFAAIALATWIGLGLKRAREPDPAPRPS